MNGENHHRFKCIRTLLGKCLYVGKEGNKPGSDVSVIPAKEERREETGMGGSIPGFSLHS